jgi:curli biogenesis system outer membrane secretion channel CsgG
MTLKPIHWGMMAGTVALAALVLAFALSPAMEAAAQTTRVGPAAEAPEQYPAHPNREDAFYFCTACHGFKIVAAQGMSRQRWDESLSWMVERHNMPDVQGEDRKKILDYLASAFPERTEPGGWKNPFAPK